MSEINKISLTNILNGLRDIISDIGSEHQNKFFSRCMSETWFSDTLAWLLDPKGSHGLGVKFANAFLNKVAELRSNPENGYKREATLLKKGRSGIGTVANFSLKNAAVTREFYLSSLIDKKLVQVNFCDIVFFDLDSRDGLFLLIENKLFTRNRRGQLAGYRAMAKKKYHTKLLECVYMTLDGSEPIAYEASDEKQHRYWVRMSWIEDIPEILKKTKVDMESSNPLLKELSDLLDWLNKLKAQIVNKVNLERFRSCLLNAATDCMVQELLRLSEGMQGQWDRAKENNRILIKHSSFPARYLFVELLPNMTVTLQTKKGERPLYSKVIVPFGTNSEQIYNMLDISCREIFKGSIPPESKENHMNNCRRLTRSGFDYVPEGNKPNMKRKYKEFFDFVAENSTVLKIMYNFSKYASLAVKGEREGVSEEMEPDSQTTFCVENT
jgi:hypothetical protein